ncbi:alpha/beta fold hydrolase [Rhodovulum sp. DZ06]|uniref:alpha/beta fold hydrolase n=1 Tax=Rhodovulum sp. DZ06 TaxID=3425126 RepID=UPI003D348E6C
MRLNTIIAEPKTPSDLPPLVIVHGLYGSAKNWGAISKRLAQGNVCPARRVVAVDLRNHGDSPWGEDASYPALASDLAETIEAECGGRADVLGHSMGGKASMQLALTRPELVNRLIAADIAPVAYENHGHLAYIRAMKGVDLSTVNRRAAAEPQLRDGVPDRALRAFLLQSLAVEEDGTARWKLNLDALEAHMPDIVGWPGTEGEFTGPTLFVHGANSDYVGPEARPQIKRLFPAARFVAVKEAGHWLHAEQPEAFVQTVGGWLKATD